MTPVGPSAGVSDMTSRDCPFCDGAIVNATFAETERLRALYNLAPLLPGHCMIVPRRHVTRLRELTVAESTEMLTFAARVADLVLDLYGCTGFDLSLQEGEAAGQTVTHLHLHIIPRRPGDLPHHDWHSQLIDSTRRARLTPEEMATQVARLRQALALKR